VKREWLVKILKKRNLTHQEAADKIGVDRSYLTQIINGKRRPSPKVAQKMGKILRFDWTIFFKDDCGEKPQKLNSKKSA
jgi:transcriptional regulator with XRE-family HTH domain